MSSQLSQPMGIFMYMGKVSHTRIGIETSVSCNVGFIHLCFLYSGGGVENGGVPKVLGFKVTSAPLVLRKTYRYRMIFEFLQSVFNKKMPLNEKYEE